MNFVDVAALDQIPMQRGLVVDVEGRSIALFRVGDAVHAIDDGCPHAGSSLGAGHLEGCVVRCRAHGLPFDVRSGRMPGNPALAVTAHGVRVRAGRVWVALAP